MALESTAINDLIAGLQQRPLQGRDSDNWLFGEPERDDATQIDTGREDRATTPFDRSTPPVVPLPGPFVRQPAAAIEYALHRPSSPTTYVRAPIWPGVAKKLALPIALACIVVVLIGVYVAKSETNAEPTVAMTAKVEEIDPPGAAAAAPAAAPAAVPAPAAPAPASGLAPALVGAPDPAPTVTPIEEPARQPNAEEPIKVEPGSPASRFLGSPTAEPTIPTVAAKPAPAPTTVADLPPPPPRQEKLGVEIEAKPTVAAKSAKPAKKTAAQLRAERRAAAKRAAKASIAATKSRSKQKVAAVEEADDDADEAEEEKPAKKAIAKGKGTLSIASTPAMEVWVDGRNSNAQTPVRIILLAGKHKVSLFDKATAKARSFEVEIKPDETTKIVKSY